MNATYLFLYAMDATTFEDTMEVGSDAGHGHLDNIDDIEIDLEFAEGQNTEHDNDVIVEDASVTASDHANTHDMHNDADMLDEEEFVDGVTQPGYAEGEEKYHNEDSTVYPSQDTYEAEMEDFEEDIDAPVPDSGAGDTNAEINTAHQSQADAPEESNPPAVGDEVSASAATSTTVQELVETVASTNEAPVPTGEDKAGEAPHEEHRENTTEVEQNDNNTTTAAKELENDDATGDKSVETYDEKIHAPVQEESKPRDGEDNRQDPKHEAAEPETHEDQQNDQTGETHYDEEPYEEYETGGEYVDLHPIKVFYQDSEISLFPPKNDDPSETFFLEDESLVHRPVNELLHACREVLGEHISEEEEVVVDIECLGLLFSEVSRSSVSIACDYTNTNTGIHPYNICHVIPYSSDLFRALWQ